MRRILVVEDMPEIREIVRCILEPRGFCVETAEDGLAGLDAIRRFEPELVLLNILMPRMDGFTMLVRLAAAPLPRKPRVVMLTGYSDSRYFESSLSLGAVEFISYPLRMKVLTQVVQEALDPTLDDSQLQVRARLRRLMAMAEALDCAGVLDEAKRLPLHRLSWPQRRDLRDGLLAAALASLRSAAGPSGKPGQADGRPRRGIAPELTLLALAEAL